MPYQEVFNEFWQHVTESAQKGEFAKLTLAKTIGKPNLKNIFVRPFASDGEFKVLVKLRYHAKETQDVETLHNLDETLEIIKPYLVSSFSTVLLFTTTKDVLFKINKKKAGSFTEKPPTFSSVVYAQLNEDKVD